MAKSPKNIVNAAFCKEVQEVVAANLPKVYAGLSALPRGGKISTPTNSAILVVEVRYPPATKSSSKKVSSGFCKEVHETIVEKLPKKYAGLHVIHRGGSFDLRDNSAKLKYEISFPEKNDKGQAMTPFALNYETMVTTEDKGSLPKLFSTINVRGRKHKIVGWNNQRRAKPILTECDGKTYIWRVEDMQSAFAMHKNAK